MLNEMLGIVRSLVEAHPRRSFWRTPIVGAVSSRDPRLSMLERIVSRDHLLPADILGDAAAVVCYFIPFSETLSAGNVPGRFASREWAESYIATNELIARANDGIASLLHSRGYSAATIPATHNFDERTLISAWSHRHFAFFAGLGSFGINNMLITDSGCSGRLGSVVTGYPAGNPDPVPPRERCLNKIDGSCGVCRKRCVARAYPGDTFDRRACYGMCLANAELHRSVGYADVCGKCVVGLPCSSRDPSAGRSQGTEEERGSGGPPGGDPAPRTGTKEGG